MKPPRAFGLATRPVKDEPGHTWTRVPAFDAYMRDRRGRRVVDVERSACRCGAWLLRDMPRAGRLRRLRPDQVVRPEHPLLEWQDGACCGPPPERI